MKSEKFLSKILIGGVFILITLTVAVVAVENKGGRFLKHDLTETSVKKARVRKQKYDPAILNNLEAVIKKINSTQVFSYHGQVTAINEADTADALVNTSFVVFKGETDSYYRIGENETINENGLYLAIDHNIKKILLSTSPESPGQSPDFIMNVKQFSEALNSENYQLFGVNADGSQTITLKNEHHITCKEYSISFDTKTFLPSRVYTRLTNFNDPLRTDNEKVIEVKISKWNESLNMSHYASANDLVSKVDGVWVGIGKCADYTIIEI